MKKFQLLGLLCLICLTIPLLADSDGDNHDDNDNGNNTKLLQKFVAIGQGKEQGDCRVGTTCTSDGTLQGNFIGKARYVSVLSVDKTTAEGNGTGGFCVNASGTTTITTSDGSKLNLAQVGEVCETGVSGTPQTFNGNFYVISGTKRFKGTTGSGNATGSDDNKGTGSLVLNYLDGVLLFARK